METGKRQGNNPKRRIAPPGRLTDVEKETLKEAVSYIGSANHKLRPADYGFLRPEPRPCKSVCDMERVILRREARLFLVSGIQRGMFSEPQADGFPKFIWSVSDEGEVFEAKTDRHGSGEYHGYPLEDEDAMRVHVLSVWGKRCPDTCQ